MKRNISIRVENLTKVYKIYDKPIARLKEAIHPLGKKYFQPFHALRDLSFAIEEGEIYAIIGRNGSGKSTLLKLLAGVLTPTAGKISVQGKVSALLELGVGFNPEFTGIENIYFYGTIMGYSRSEMDERVDDIRNFADIGDFIHQPVKIYSSGMFARLAFAAAIHVDPDILIVDEALAIGDIAFQTKCYRKFNEFRDAGKTILFVTHDMDTVLKYCRRALVLEGGQKVAEGPAKDMVDVYKKLIVVSERTDPLAPCSAEAPPPGEWKQHFNLNPQFLEYGTKAAEIIDFGLFDESGLPLSVVLHDAPVEIRLRVKFHDTLTEPIFAFAVKDLKGTELVGTNTLFETTSVGRCQAGEIRTAHFRQALNLRSGHYTLSFGCTAYVGEDLVIYHRLYDMILFEIVSLRHFSGLSDVHAAVWLTPS